MGNKTLHYLKYQSHSNLILTRCWASSHLLSGSP